MLSDEKTLEYIRAAKEGDSFAKEELITHNTSLIKSIVKRYLNKGVDYDDLFQLASMGLLKAITGFDESYGVKFSTYAVPMIAGEIKRFMRDDGSIKVSRAIKFAAKNMNRYIEDFSAAHGRAPTVKEISKEFGVEEKSRERLDKLPAVDNQEEMVEKMQLKTALEKLPEREKKIIMLRYFRDMTQSEVAEVIGVSQVQISRIENKIVSDMKKQLSC